MTIQENEINESQISTDSSDNIESGTATEETTTTEAQEIPSDDSETSATQEVGTEFEGYTYDLPETLAKDPEVSKWLNALAKDANFTQAQAQKVADVWSDIFNNIQNYHETSYNQSEAVLQKEWGKEFSSNLKLAQNALKHFGSPDLIKELDATGVGNSVHLIKTLSKIGKLMKEDKFVGLESQEKPPEVERKFGMPMLKFNM
jgi:hypothetical protein